MSEEETHANGGSGGSSMMDALRAQHEKLAKSMTIDLPVPGYEDLLVGKYRMLNIKGEISPIGRKVSRESQDPMEQGLLGMIDLIIAACVELFYPDPNEEGKLIPLSEGAGLDAPVRYDQNLAMIMGWDMDEIDSARKCVRRLFQGAEPMIMRHGQELSLWMQDSTRQVNTSFAGNL